MKKIVTQNESDTVSLININQSGFFGFLSDENKHVLISCLGETLGWIDFTRIGLNNFDDGARLDTLNVIRDTLTYYPGKTIYQFDDYKELAQWLLE